MKETGVRILRNEIVEYKGIQIIGAEGPERDNQKDTAFLRKLEIKKGLPSCINVSPALLGIEYAVKAGINLQVSGHTP